LRSLFTKIFLWFLATTLVSLAALLTTSTLLLGRFGPDDFFAHTIALQIEDARHALDEGGASGLSSYLRRLNAH
jgi:hypothetical protein